METEMEKAARAAAAKYSTAPQRAVAEYVCLTGHINTIPEKYRCDPAGPRDQIYPPVVYEEAKKEHPDIDEKYPKITKAAKIYLEAEDEMLALLPQYRHPVKGGQTERMIFFCKQEPEQASTEITYPAWYDDFIQDTALPADLKDSILFFIDQALENEVALKKAEAEKTEMVGQIFGAWDAYQPEYEGEDSMTRARRVVRVLGLSKGKRPPSPKHRSAYYDYFYLVRKEGLSRRKATETIQQKHDYPTIDAALKALHGQLSRVKKRWKDEDPEGWESQKIESYFEGLILSRREVIDPSFS